MYTFKVGDRVTLCASSSLSITGTVVGFTTLGEVVEGDCEDDEKDDVWCKVCWDEEFDSVCPNNADDDVSIGVEAESSLKLLLSLVK